MMVPYKRAKVGRYTILAEGDFTLDSHDSAFDKPSIETEDIFSQ